MPTVPSTCVPLDSRVSVSVVSAFADADILNIHERTAGPTPDPDTDDVVLVPVEQGNAVSQDSFDREPPQTSVKPRLDLSSLNLHSPSSIVGTPFDVSPRFEYPFPPATCSPPFPSIYDFDPALPSIPPLYSHMSAFPSMAPPPASTSTHFMSGALTSRTRGDTRSFSPTHPKLQSRDPPIPPSLVKKRRLHKAGTLDTSLQAPPIGRPRAGSFSDLTEKLGRVAEERARGRLDGALLESLDAERERSHSLDMKRKRIPFARQSSDVTVVDHDGDMLDAKPPLSHVSSSRTLHPDSDAEDKLTEESPRSSSPSPQTSARPSSEETPRLPATLPPASPPPALSSSESSPL
ncbi:hypothetical protein BV20DRAFT_447276 [Pilatotrama ljubarskyi]|nr:hypothetical protein BV20DRAFT_447276 [Pilatotrama ljubarskyi]